MKKLFIIFLIVIAGGYLWKNRKADQEQNAPLEAFNDPVYAEIRVPMSVGGRSIEGLMLAKTADQADCQKSAESLEKALALHAPKICPTCNAKVTTACKHDLPARYLELFDDQPVSLTYISFTRGARTERDFRLIYWGLTVEESHKLCSATSDFNKGLKGKVICVRARPT